MFWNVEAITQSNVFSRIAKLFIKVFFVRNCLCDISSRESSNYIGKKTEELHKIKNDRNTKQCNHKTVFLLQD